MSPCQIHCWLKGCRERVLTAATCHAAGWIEVAGRRYSGDYERLPDRSLFREACGYVEDCRGESLPPKLLNLG